MTEEKEKETGERAEGKRKYKREKQDERRKKGEK